MNNTALEGARVLSGIRPTTAVLHVGNYYGALRQFVTLQDMFPKRCFFFIADLHTIGDVTDAETMRQNSLGIATEFLAAGLDPAKATLYIQSAVPQLADLTWLLTAVTNDTELLGLPHYREKRDKYAAKENVEGAPSTFLFYPVLQAADILFTAPAGEKILVPVGQDQRAHIEFTRDVARKFNNRYGEMFGEPTLPEDINVFTDPEGRGNIRIKGLDGKEKMGKSEGNAIFLEESPETIRERVAKGVTDPDRKRRTDPGDTKNCIGIYPLHEFVTDKKVRDEVIVPGCRNATLSCTACKDILIRGLTDQFSDFREKKQELLQQPDYVRNVLEEGARHVRQLVDDKLRVMHKAMGLASYIR